MGRRGQPADQEPVVVVAVVVVVVVVAFQVAEFSRLVHR